MPRTPQEEAEYQALGQQLGINLTPQLAPPESQGLLSFTGQSFANAIPEAAQNIIGPAQALLGFPQEARSQISNFFQTPAPQGVAQNIIGGAAQLASYLPAMIATEGGAAAGISELGLGATAAKIGGAAAGFGLPMADQGPEQVAVQGGVGALQTAARDWGWKGKLAAGLIGGAAGYYEGQKESPQTGAVYGALNLAFPTVVDPLIDHILGYNRQNNIEQGAQDVPPAQPSSAPQGPISTPTTDTMPPQPPDIGGGRPIAGQIVPFDAESPLTAQQQIVPAEPDFGQWVNPRAVPDRIGSDPLGLSVGSTQIEQPTALPEEKGLLALPDHPTLEPTGPIPLALEDQKPVFASLQEPEPPSPSVEPVSLAAETTPKPSRVIAAPGGEIPIPTMEGPHIIATAVKQGKKLLVGSEPFAAHNVIGLEHGLTDGTTDVPEDKRGFLVQNSDGSQGFANRQRAGKIALKAGQISEPIASLQSEDLRLKPSAPNSPQPVEPAAAKGVSEPSQSTEPSVASLQTPEKVRIKGRFGLEDATVNAREGDTLHVTVHDPIFGDRETSVLASDTLPAAEEAKPIAGGVPFKDVESAKLTGKEGAQGSTFAGESEDEMRGSVLQGAGAKTTKHVRGLGNLSMSVEEGLQKLPPEASTLLGNIIKSLKGSVGRDIDTSLHPSMGPGVRGGAYEQSGRVALNLSWIHRLVKNWDTLSPLAQSKALMQVAGTFAHEITHVAQMFGERSGLAVEGKPLLDAVMGHVDSMSLEQRRYVIQQISEAKGKVSSVVNDYLAGNIDKVFDAYKGQYANLTMQKAKELAAGEFMAEIGSTELIKKMQVQGMPNAFRSMVDKFKSVLVNTVAWLKEKLGMTPENDALASLQKISSQMFDHFAAADTTELAKAYPASDLWQKPPPESSPFSSVSTAPRPQVSVVEQGFLKSELARMGVRMAVGGVTGGIIGPQIAPNQVTMSEGIILGGILGAAGPAVAKALLKGNLPQEVAAAARASGGSPLKLMTQLLSGGKTFDQLAREGQYSAGRDASIMAKFARLSEIYLDTNFDPVQRALMQNATGLGNTILRSIFDAADRAMWFKPDDNMIEAVGEYFTGKLSKEDFQTLLTSDDLKNYGNMITTMREGQTTLSQMAAEGMKDGALKTAIQETSQSYLGKFYKAFVKGEFDPSFYQAAKADLMKTYPGITPEMADNVMMQYMDEVKGNRSMFGSKPIAQQTIDSTILYRRLATPEEIEAQKVLVAGLEHDPNSPDYTAAKSRLNWMQSHPITDAWAGWLGEMKNPIDRMIMTIQKVYPASVSSKMISMFDDWTNSKGLKFAYDATSLQQVMELQRHEMSKLDPKSSAFASLQDNLTHLSGYAPLPEGAQYGKLSGKWVDRRVRDSLGTDGSPFKWLNNPFMRGVAAFNNYVKLARGPLNPLTVLRNVMQIPLFGLIARTGPGDLARAYTEIFKNKGAEYQQMLKLGILDVNQSATELSKGPGFLMSGFADADIATKLAKVGMQKALDFYGAPDNLNRAAAFMAAKDRFAEQLRVNREHLDVLTKAQEFTDRFTMNYSTVPPIVKAGRQLPFVSLFLSYASEITKILKNLTQDTIGSDTEIGQRMHAVTTLSAMAAIPAVLTAMFEGQLSPKDQQDWQQLKRLAPDDLRTRFRLPINRDKDGRFHFLDITNLLPADDYSRMMNAFVHGDMKGAIAANPIFALQNTPLLNIVSEQVQGQDLATGRQIAGFGRVQEILKETLPPVIPPGYEGTRLANAFSSDDQGQMGLTNLRTGVQTKPSDIVANYLTGMRFGNVQLSTVQRGAVGEAQQKIATQQQFLRDTTNTNLPANQKTQAIEHYRQAVTQIMLELHSKIGS